jgi:hypothetical protein
MLATAHLAEGNFAAALAAIDAGLALKPGDGFFTRMRELVDGYQVYQDGMLEKRNSIYMDYPPVVHLETYAKCNASCGFCPYETLDRLGTRMPDALISKVINDLTDIPASVPFIIAPQKVNEPFLDKRIFAVFAEIAAKLPNAKLLINTNAAALSDGNIAKLAKVTNVARMWISLNEHRPGYYEALMKLPLAHHPTPGRHSCRKAGWASFVSYPGWPRRRRHFGGRRISGLGAQPLFPFPTGPSQPRRLGRADTVRDRDAHGHRLPALVRSFDHRHRPGCALLHGWPRRPPDRRYYRYPRPRYL